MDALLKVIIPMPMLPDCFGEGLAGLRALRRTARGRLHGEGRAGRAGLLLFSSVD